MISNNTFSKKLIRTLFAITLSTGFFCAPLVAQDKGTDLTIYFDSSHRPYAFLNDGRLDGINAVTIMNACQLAEVKCEFVPVPWARGLATVMKDSDAGLLNAARNASREPFFNWVGPLASGQTMYFKLKSRTDILIEKPKDVLNYTLGVMRNDIYESVLLARGFRLGENLLQTSGKNDPVRLFLAGKLDLMIASMFTLTSSLELLGGDVNDVEAVAWLLTPEFKGNFLAVNPNVPASIVSAINKGLDEYRRTAAFNQLNNRFRPPNIQTPSF